VVLDIRVHGRSAGPSGFAKGVVKILGVWAGPGGCECSAASMPTHVTLVLCLLLALLQVSKPQRLGQVDELEQQMTAPLPPSPHTHVSTLVLCLLFALLQGSRLRRLSAWWWVRLLPRIWWWLSTRWGLCSCTVGGWEATAAAAEAARSGRAVSSWQGLVLAPLIKCKMHGEGHVVETDSTSSTSSTSTSSRDNRLLWPPSCCVAPTLLPRG
jgi:hypothetical protein